MSKRVAIAILDFTPLNSLFGKNEARILLSPHHIFALKDSPIASS
jgi:hypothetical protein